MRGACALACGLLALAALCAATQPAPSAAPPTAPSAALPAVERQLLALLGLRGRPPRRAAPPRVPPALRRLYDARAPLPASAANTARSYTHAPSPLDVRFPHAHRTRLFFNVSVPADEMARGAALTLSREHDADPAAPPQRLLLYDIVRPGRRGQSAPLLRLLDSAPLHAGDGGVALDAAEAARRWLREPGHNHGLLLRVLDAAGAAAAAPRVRTRRAAPDDALQPLLLLYTEDERARQTREATAPVARARRAAGRRAHRPHHRRKEARELCQRRPLYVDFADVGWNDWIVAPHGYDAYYCQGDCPFPLADHLNGTNHAIVQTLVNSVNPAAVPKACCVPTQLSSISMLFLDEMNNLVLKNYQDMMVVGCGCR